MGPLQAFHERRGEGVGESLQGNRRQLFGAEFKQQIGTLTRAVHGAIPAGGLRPSNFIPDEIVSHGPAPSDS
jgi:hypothetical protein